MTRTARLRSAKDTKWVANYGGKHIVRSYSKWYGVDRLCAISELRLLGVTVSVDYENKARASVDALADTRRRKKEERERKRQAELQCLEYEECDENFSYIAGYASNGFPFGVTWEEMGEAPRGFAKTKKFHSDILQAAR